MTINKKKILFSILAGGQSKRFGGGFKAFAKINGITMLEKTINKLKKYSNEIIINANDLENFKKINYPIIEDRFKGFLGPLAGIHTSMLWAKENYTNKEWVFTVPSDTPFLPDNLLNKFLESYGENIKILIARSNSRHHPVIAMWHISLITSLENELKLKNSKIMFWVKKHKYKFVEKKCSLNVFLIFKYFTFKFNFLLQEWLALTIQCETLGARKPFVRLLR